MRILIDVTDDDVSLTVTNDGAGIGDRAGGGNELINMAHRARQLSGHFAITAQASGGSVLTWRAPRRRELPDAPSAPPGRCT